MNDCQQTCCLMIQQRRTWHCQWCGIVNRAEHCSGCKLTQEQCDEAERQAKRIRYESQTG